MKAMIYKISTNESKRLQRLAEKSYADDGSRSIYKYHTYYMAKFVYKNGFIIIIVLQQFFKS